MRVSTRIRQYEVVVLINSRSTHNFISEKMTNLLQMSVVLTKPFNVRVANGCSLKCQGQFEHVQILLQGILFSITLYFLPLIELDLVLGIQWLKQLGIVVCNWKKMTMEFQWQNQPQMIQRTNEHAIQVASLKATAKELMQRSSMFSICVQPLGKTTQQDVHPDMQQLLESFDDIFQGPKQLPQTREVNHHIQFFSKKEPSLSMWDSIGMPIFKKLKLKKKIHVMLKLGLIRSNISQFSSPIL